MHRLADSSPSADFFLGGKGLVQLRLGLAISLGCAILIGIFLLDLRLPWLWLTAILALMAVSIGYTARLLARSALTKPALARQLAFDLCAMAAMFYLTGGATNPLVSLLLVPVTVAALAMPMRLALILAGLAVVLYSLLMFFSLPLPIEDVARATRLHLIGMWLTFVVSAWLIAMFLSRLTDAIRRRDAELAAAREQALRDAQVVALAQLAAGAAHELGTPLATMRVICGELRRDTRLPEDCRADLEMLERQIEQCKTIIGGMTARAGHRRAEDMHAVAVTDWLTGVLERWRSYWPEASCRMRVETDATSPQWAPPPEVEQAVISLLNNAARIAPRDIELRLAWNEDWLRITVADQGPGFPPQVLAAAGGKPLPAHEQGAGLGLWLARSAIERLGGKLRLANDSGGATVTIELPRKIGS
ncbi:MAG: ATP-binding protein [Rhodocyclaceae bacterium]|nr:ATP-binding protein [Rhodocyclaceae bacterium]